jgi:hypothetical protein
MGNATRKAVFLIAAGMFIFAAGAQTNTVIVAGFVTDTLSGRRGANSLHANAARRNVASGMAKYAIYDEKTKKLFILDQQTAMSYLGQRVTATGTLVPSPMVHAGQRVNSSTNRAEDLHHVGQDSSTPIAGALTISTITVTPPRVQRN